MPRRAWIAAGLALPLMGCFYAPDGRGEAARRVDAKNRCEAIGYKPGNADFDRCVAGERGVMPSARR